MGRIAPELLRPGRRHPAHAAARGARAHRRAGARVRPAGRQRLPRRRRQPAPARLLRRRGAEGEAERAEELAGLILEACVDAGGSITGEHGVGVDKKRYMPQMFDEADLGDVPAAALRLRPRRPRQPRQGDAHAAAVRRGAGALPPAPARGGRPGGALLMGGTPTLRRETPASADEAAALLRSATEDGARVRFVRRRDEARLGAPDPRARRAALDRRARPDRRAQRRRPHRGPRARACRSAARAGAVRADGPDARARPAAGRRRRRDDRRRRRHRRLRARCATATAPCATSSSASPSRSRDGTVAKAGGKVIKNVAGYDLGQALRRRVRDARADRRGRGAAAPAARARRRPRWRGPPTRSALARAARGPRPPAARARGARPVAGRAAPARCSPATAAPPRRPRRQPRAKRLAGLEDAEVVDDDEGAWAAQRAGQRPRRARSLRDLRRCRPDCPPCCAPPSATAARVRRAGRPRPVLARAGRPRARRARCGGHRAARRARARAVHRARRARGAAAAIDPWDGDAHSAVRAARAASRSASTRPAPATPHLFVGGI